MKHVHKNFTQVIAVASLWCVHFFKNLDEIIIRLIYLFGNLKDKTDSFDKFGIHKINCFIVKVNTLRHRNSVVLHW